MSFHSFGRHRPLNFRRLGLRRFASTRATAIFERPKVFTSRRKWYALGAATASVVGFWAWSANNSRQAAFASLSPDYFMPAKLISSEKANKNAKLLRLTIPSETFAKAPKTSPQPIWSIYVKDSDIQVERPYTPLEGLSADGEMTFWIKEYEHGEVGRWLHRRIPGENIEIRGPERTWAWQEDTWDNVIMISGGTGIAPFYQLLHSLFSDSTKTPKTKFTLLQSYCAPRELPPPMILQNLSLWKNENPENLKVRTFVDRRGSGPEKDNLIVGRINKDALRLALQGCSGRTIVLICGPDPMMNALAGPKGRNETQGTLGGVLGSLHDGSFQVWKL